MWHWCPNLILTKRPQGRLANNAVGMLCKQVPNARRRLWTVACLHVYCDWLLSESQVFQDVVNSGTCWEKDYVINISYKSRVMMVMHDYTRREWEWEWRIGSSWRRNVIRIEWVAKERSDEWTNCEAKRVTKTIEKTKEENNKWMTGDIKRWCMHEETGGDEMRKEWYRDEKQH